MRKIICDMCGNEITEQISVNGTFHGTDGLLVSITIRAPEKTDLCKACVIKIIKHGKAITWRDMVGVGDDE